MSEERRPLWFTVKFRPRVGWADQAYFGNLLIEVLGVMARNTGAFDFEVEAREATGSPESGR